MNSQKEVAAALAEHYATETLDEACIIDERTIPGSLSIEPSPITLMDGGWSEKVTGLFATLKTYFDGNYPVPMKSTITFTANGKVFKRQVKQIKGPYDLHSEVKIGYGSFDQ